MCQINKQMFRNKIIQIIALIWLMKQQQIVFCVAGQLTETTAVTLITTSQQQLKHIKNITKPLMKIDEKEYYSSENNNNKNTTITSNRNITSNKLNVNNTDTQMTLKLKDATARNACVTNYLKCLTLPASAIEQHYDKSTSANYNSRREFRTSFQISIGKPPMTTDATRSFANASNIFLGRKLIQNILRSPPETVASYLHNKRKPIIKETTLHLTEQNELKENTSSTKQDKTITNNLIRNNNLINKKDLNLQQQSREINKEFHSRILKDKQVNYVERKAVKGLIEKGNESSQAAGKTTTKEQEKQNMMTKKHKETQKNYNKLSVKKNEKIFRKFQINKTNGIKEKQKKNNKNADETTKEQLNLQSAEKINLNKIKNSSDIKTLSTIAFAAAKLSPRASVLVYSSESTKAFPKNDLSLKVQQNFSKVNDKKAQEEICIKNDKAKKLPSFHEKAIEADSSSQIQPQLPSIKLSMQQENKAEEWPTELKQTELKLKEVKLLKKELKFKKPKFKDDNRNKKLQEKSRDPDTKKYVNERDQNHKNKQNEKLTIKREKENQDKSQSRTNKNFFKENSKQHDIHKSNKDITIKNEHNNKHDDKTIIPSTTTFHRQKRLNLDQISPLQTLKLLQRSQNENSTEIEHHPFSEKKSANLNSSIFKQNNKIKTPTKTDEQSVASEKKMLIKFENESVEMETENLRKLNLIKKQEQLAFNRKVNGNGNSMMPTNKTMNYKQQNGSLNKSINFIVNGKQIVSELNAASMEATKKSADNKLSKSIAEEEKTTATIKEFLSTSPMIDNVPPLAVTQQNLLDFQTTKDIASFSHIQSTPALKVTQNSFQRTTVQPFINDIINIQLFSTEEENKTSALQLISTTSTTTSTESSFSHETIIFPLPAPSTSDTTAGFLSTTLATTSSTTASPSWPVKHASVMEGDVILGGLMMVHSREDSITCGPIMPQGGIQALEAMLYTLDQVNKQELLPNITLGAHILDDCDKDTYGLEMAVDFIKGKFGIDIYKKKKKLL